MKTFFSCVAILLFVSFSQAQYFTLTPNGFVADNKNDFAVVEIPGVKQDELYKNVLNAINTIYSNPQNGLNVVSGESISLSATQTKAIKSSAGIMTYDYDIDYTLSFLFKDGKIRINSPKFEAYMQNYNGTWNTLNIKKAYFKNNGEIKSEKNYKQINDFFNNLIKRVLDKSSEINKW